VDNLTAVEVLGDTLRNQLPAGAVVVSPDEGRVHMAGEFAHLLGLDLAIVHKERTRGTATRTVAVAGNVRDRPCLLIDDMITTGETVARAVAALLAAGARPDITVAATSEARTHLSHPAIRKIIVTDSITQEPGDRADRTVVSVAPLLAAAIMHLVSRASLGSLFPPARSGGD
jgi:ribose-phosphate pyrophosphokinase